MTVHFDDLSPGRCQCRYPLWKGRDRTGLVCGEPTKAGSSYCAEHHAVVYEPATPRRVTALAAIAGRIVRNVARHQPANNIHPEFEDAK